jgi:hypothetical protein
LECFGDPGDVREGDVALASLDRAVVGAVEAALEREGFLGDALILAYGADRVCGCCVAAVSTRPLSLALALVVA